MYYVIYQTAFIGDIILATSMVRTIKNVEPDANIIFITTPAGKNLLLNNRLINNIIVYDKRYADSGIQGLLRTVRSVKDIIGKEDSVFISPHRFLRASISGVLIGSKQSAGFFGSALSFLYNSKVPYDFGIHEIERNRRLLSAALAPAIIDDKPPMPELYPSEDDYDKVKKIIFEGLGRVKKIVAVAPGAVWNTKRWPEGYYQKLAVLLNDRGIRTIMIGGGDDADLCVRISSAGSVNLAGRLSLLESAAAVSLADALVTNDSAPLHMASAMRVPAVAIFGSTTPYFGFGPLSDRSVVLENSELECRPCGRHGLMKCPHGHFDCMKKIYPEAVFEEVIKIF